MKSYLGTVFLVFLIFQILTQCQSQQQRRRKGSYIAGRNNMPVYTDGQIPKIQRVKVEQRQKFHQMREKVQKGTTYKDYMFDLQGIEDFMINLPIKQQVTLSLFNYVIMDGAYLTLTNIDNQPSIKVQIYENDGNLIQQSEFYFQNFIIFQGRQHSIYTLRFINEGSPKMIAMSLKKLTQSNHIQQLISQDIVQSHAFKTQGLFEELKVIFNDFERFTVINFQSVKILLKEISYYFYWHLIETFMAVLICIFQVFSIEKICKAKPII